MADLELTIVTMRFDAADPAALLAILSKYVVLTRMQPGCRNVDLCGSVTAPGRYLVIQKWDSPAAQRAHFDSPEMVEMAAVVPWRPRRAARHRPVGRGQRPRPRVASASMTLRRACAQRDGTIGGAVASHSLSL